MYPSRFNYESPSTIEEAIALLDAGSKAGGDAESDGEHVRNLPMASVSAPTEVGSDN